MATAALPLAWAVTIGMGGDHRKRQAEFAGCPDLAVSNAPTSAWRDHQTTAARVRSRIASRISISIVRMS